MGLQFKRIEVNLYGFFLANVRRSRGKFDEIKRLIMTNLAPVGSRSSLNVGESWWTQDLPSNLLNFFMNQSRVKKQREEHRLLKRNFRKNCGPFDPVEGRFMAMITRQSVHDRTAIEPWSRGDHGSWSLLIPPSDFYHVSRWVHV